MIDKFLFFDIVEGKKGCISMNRSKNGTTDMTVGSPLQHIIYFAIPILIGNFFQHIYNLVDTMVAGYCLGDDAIAAIGATASLYALLIDLIMGLNSGYGIVIAQSFGAREEKRIRQSLAGTVLLNAGVTVCMTVGFLAALKPLLRLMNTPEAVFQQAWLYIAFICCGLFATSCYNMMSAILRALGNSKTPLYFLILSSVLNIILDVILIAVLGTGIAGAAAATVAAQAVSGFLCARLFIRNYREYLPGREDFAGAAAIMKELISSGLAMGLMYCVVDIGSVIFTSANNLLGKTIITAHIAARRLIMLIFQPVGAIAGANATFAGQNWGARQYRRILQGLRQVICLEAAWGAAALVMVFLFGEQLIRLSTGTVNPEIIQNGILSMRIHGCCCWALGILLSLRTAMQAMGHKAAPLTASTAELVMKVASAWYFIPKYGFIATCFTEPVIWVVCMLFLVVVYFGVNRKELEQRN